MFEVQEMHDDLLSSGIGAEDHRMVKRKVILLSKLGGW